MLAGLIALTHLGSTAPPPPSPSRLALASPSTSPAIRGLPLATDVLPAPTPVAQHPPSTVIPGALPGALPVRTIAGDSRFADGIPTTHNLQLVARVGTIPYLSTGTSLLVAGWYQPLACPSVTDGFWCWPGALFDLPAGSSRTDAVALDVSLGDVAGPRIVRATVAPNANCMLDGGNYCPPILSVKRVVWSGDRATLTAPIDPMTLLSELDAHFSYVDFLPLAAADDCRASLPVQAYTAAPVVGMTLGSGLPMPVTLVLLFPSSAPRRAFRPEMLATCQEIYAQLADSSGVTFIGKRNVLLLSTNSPTEPEVGAALDAALEQARGN